jgi:hypothetical protein
VAYDFEIGKNNIKLYTEYENVTYKIVFGNAVLAPLMSERKYDVMPQNGNCSRESNVRTFSSKQSPISKGNVLIELNMGKIHLQIM